MKKKIGKKKRGNKLCILIMLFLILAAPVIPNSNFIASGAENVQVKMEQTGGYFAVQGDKNIALKVRVSNDSDEYISFSAKTNLETARGDITEPNPNEGIISLEEGQSTEIVFTLDISNNAKVGSHSISILLIDKGENKGDILRSKTVRLQISKKTTTQSAEYPGNYMAAADLVHSLNTGDAILAGVTNELTLAFNNKGNTVMKDAKVTLVLPEGITVHNASSTLSVGYVNIGSSKTVVFPLRADESLESKDYPITVRLEFFNKENSAQTIEQTLYIPVEGSGTHSLQDLVISGISLPDRAYVGEDFTLTFQVENKGSYETDQLKIFVEVPDSLANRTKSLFIEPELMKGQKKSYSVTLFARDGSDERNYTIPIAIEPASGAREGDRIVQYANIFIDKSGIGSVKTPQLMVSDYNFGGTYVHAGEEFRLDLGLTNTSSYHDLQNIKVTLDSGDGTFIPVQSSNSFYIDQIERNGYAQKSLFLSVKPDAEQKTTSVNISMSYEDSSGNAFTTTDVISIPVMQETRLVVDDIIAPPELYVGMQNGVSIDFYNMGKTTLHNLRVSAEGDFDTMESNSYYAGNMSEGSTDTFYFSFMPRNVGLMEGSVTFTFEDASGDEQVIQKEFAFEIMEMPVWNEEPFPIEEPMQNKFPWIPVIVGLVIIGVIAGILIHKRRKKKMHQEMEIDE